MSQSDAAGRARAARRSLAALALPAVALASGCGGGGGGGTSPPPPPPPTFSGSGQLSGNPYFRRDGDVNDPTTTLIANDDRNASQSLFTPAVVKGYVTKDPTGQDGDRFETLADAFDYYYVSVLAGQRLVLDEFEESGGAESVDLDLHLTTLAGLPVTSSISTTNEREQIVVATAGTYIAVVEAFRGASSYTLTLTALDTGAAVSQIELAAVAPGRISVAAEPQSPEGRRFVDLYAEPSSRGPLGRTAGAYTTPMTTPAMTSQAAAIAAAPPSRLRARLEAVAADRGAPRPFFTPDDEARLATLELAKSLNAAEGRDIFRPQRYPRVHVVDPGSDPLNFSVQWNLAQVAYGLAKERIDEGGGLPRKPVVAIIDTGIFGSHPDIASVIRDERDMVPASVDGDGFDPDAEEVVDINDPNCLGFHGSHVASIATAPINGQGIIGVAPGADLIAIKIGHSVGTGCDFLQGDIPGAIRYAARLPNPSGALPPVRADVINMSFGASTPDAAEEAAINEARAAGVLLVASGGNDNNTSPNYPAASPGVIAVAATNRGEGRAWYSQQYPQVDIAAPGGDSTADPMIFGAVATVSGGALVADYARKQGTSMASPHVAAGLAMMRAIAPTITPAHVDSMLANGNLTDDLGAAGKDNTFGHGLMSLIRMATTAFNYTGVVPPPPPRPALSLTQADFGEELDSITLMLSKDGEGELSVRTSFWSLPQLDALFLSAVDVDADGFGEYRLTLDRSVMRPGTATGNFGFSFSDGTLVSLPLRAVNYAAVVEPESAALYVVLQQGGSTVDQIVVPGGLGGPLPSGPLFSGVGQGSYRLVYGTDMDNDGLIGDPGELFGVYPSSTSTFTLNSNLTGIDLVLTDGAPSIPMASLDGQPRALAAPVAVDKGKGVRVASTE